jgi:hypothetical protein
MTFTIPDISGFEEAFRVEGFSVYFRVLKIAIRDCRTAEAKLSYCVVR